MNLKEKTNKLIKLIKEMTDHKDLKNEEILLTHSASQDNGCFDCSVHFVKKTEDFECD